MLATGRVSLCVAEARRPNVILIYTDDQACWAAGAYGNREIVTPHIDGLARAGMRFDRAFTKPACSPSRAMVLTGLYSHRVGIPDHQDVRPHMGGTGKSEQKCQPEAVAFHEVIFHEILPNCQYH